MISIARFVLAILYVTVVTAPAADRRLPAGRVLYHPGRRARRRAGQPAGILVAGAAAIALYLLPVLSATPDTWTIDAQRAVALGGTAILLSIGTRARSRP